MQLENSFTIDAPIEKETYRAFAAYSALPYMPSLDEAPRVSTISPRTNCYGTAKN